MKSLFFFTLFTLSTGVFAFEQCSYNSETVAFRRYEYTNIHCTDRHMIDLIREAQINIENQYDDWANIEEGLAEVYHHPLEKKAQQREHAQYLANRIRQDRGTSNKYYVYYPHKDDRLAVENILLSHGYSTVDHVTFIKLTLADRVDPRGRINSSDRTSFKSIDSVSGGPSGHRVKAE